MSKTINEIFGLSKKDGDVGIEVEVEFKPGTPVCTTNIGCWTVKPDGSLKNGNEFVTRAPLKCGPTLQEKIEQLTSHLYQDFQVVENSPRTSVHVHCNVGNLTLVQTVTAMCALMLLETPLAKFAGNDNRLHNHFCIRTVSAPGQVRRIIENFLNKNTIPFNGMLEDYMKYSAINVARVRDLGTIEVRLMRGMYDPGAIAEWANGCYNVVNMASQLQDPTRLIEVLIDHGPARLVDLLCDEAFRNIVKTTPNYDKDILSSAEYVGQIAYCYEEDSPTWDLWQKKRLDLLKSNMLNSTPSAGINSIPIYQTPIHFDLDEI